MPESILVRCRDCDSKIKLPLKYQGRIVNCPRCGHRLKIPIIERKKPTVRAFIDENSQTEDSAAADDFANFDLSEFDDYGTIDDSGDLDDQPATTKPKSRTGGKSKSRKKKPRKKKKAMPSFRVSISIDPKVFGGLAVMLFGGGLFWWAWIHGFIWPWAGIICLVGLIGMISGFLGFGD